jgi:hypothetical protein
VDSTVYDRVHGASTTIDRRADVGIGSFDSGELEDDLSP